MIAACAITLSAQDKADLQAVTAIRTETLEKSKVLDHIYQLTEARGHRLTGSPGYKEAADWAVSRLKEYGLQNVRLEKWGPFGRGWTFTKYEASMVAPTYMPLIGFPMAWTSGTNGPVSGEVIIANIRSEADMKQWAGKLKGKILLMSEPREITQSERPLADRHDERDLANLANAAIPNSQLPGMRAQAEGGPLGRAAADMPPALREEITKLYESDPSAAMEKMRAWRLERTNKMAKFFQEEGVAGGIQISYAADGGTVFASSYGSYDAKSELVPMPVIAITAEHYNRLYRLVRNKQKVEVSLDIKAEFFDQDLYSYNVVGEIPGTTKKDEVVMLGAHLDSWHGGTGATDNAAGCAVVMEAARAIVAAGLKPQRTIRVALWSGEEQGLLGSRAYVKERFADRDTMKLTSEHGKISGYFNLDNGTGKIRGVYLQGNAMVGPIFQAWMEPFKDLGMTTLTIRNTGGTDHLSFDAVGIPGFQFIQDPMEYSTRTHHSNMDVADHISGPDLMQASTIMASFVYHTAQRPEMLPRKALPKPTKKDAAKPVSE